jgi:hypothetical protein
MVAEQVQEHNLSVALWWAAQGMAVFPVNPETKAPWEGFTSWEEKATTDETVIRYWFERYQPTSVPALAVGRANLVVIDADRKPGKPDGVQAWVDICSANGIDPWAGPVVGTPSGGLHVFYRQNGVQLGNGEGAIRGKQINVRGHGGYVVAAGSSSQFGSYNLLPNIPTFDAIPVIPDAIEELLKSSPAAQQWLNRPITISAEVTSREAAWANSALSGWCQELSGTFEGGRNNRLNAAAHKMASMVARGWINGDTVWSALYTAAVQCGLSDKEIRQTYASAFASGTRKPHPDLEVIPLVPGIHNLQFPNKEGNVASDQIGSNQPQTEAVKEGYQITETGLIVPHFEHLNPATDDEEYNFAPGVLGEVMKFIHEQSTNRVRQYSIAGGLILAAAICGSAWNVSIIGRPMGLNLYCGVIGGSGTGKSSARSGISTLITAAAQTSPNISQFVGPKVVSAAGARDYFAQSSSYYTMWGEWQGFVENIQYASRNTNLADIKSSVLEWFDLSGKDEALPMTGHKDPKLRSKRIVGPAFSILADSTPNVLYHLGEESITSGFIPRHLLFIYEGSKASRAEFTNAVHQPPAWLVSYLGQLADHAARVQAARMGEATTLALQYPTTMATVSSEAMPWLEWLRSTVDFMQVNSDPHLSPLFNRTEAIAARAAALCAVFDNPQSPVITAAHMQWAAELARRCALKVFNRVASGKYSKGDVALVKRLEDIIRERFAKGPASAYRFTKEMHEQGVISRSTLFIRSAAIEPFKSYPRGSAAGLELALTQLEQAGKLYRGDWNEVTNHRFNSARMGSRGAIFIKIVDRYLLGLE